MQSWLAGLLRRERFGGTAGFHPGARDLLARHTPKKGARGARRVLKRHLIDVIHRAMLQERASWQHHVTQHLLAV
ncbi:hypothetical protein [Streptomyces sp. NPDC093093]|uniref:hypothetical protein n=1 Tax=Streptomyces sp. NPDC093093 TaxID=3366025 RepID=UPI00382786F0